MKISIQNCSKEDCGGFGKNPKKIIRKRIIKKHIIEELRLAFVSHRIVSDRQDEDKADIDDTIWLSFNGPVSKKELKEIIAKLDVA